MNVFSKKSRLFTQADLRLSTLVRESTAITHTLSEDEFLFFGSEHPTVLITDQKHIFFFIFQKSNPIFEIFLDPTQTIEQNKFKKKTFSANISYHR